MTSPSTPSYIIWPEPLIPTRAGPQWLHVSGFNQAIDDCKKAYDRHVQLYGSHPTQTYLIADFPRDASRADIQQKDYLGGYESALSRIEKEFTQAQPEQTSPSRKQKP